MPKRLANEGLLNVDDALIRAYKAIKRRKDPKSIAEAVEILMVFEDDVDKDRQYKALSEALDSYFDAMNKVESSIIRLA